MKSWHKNLLGLSGVLGEELVRSLHLGARLGAWLFRPKVLAVWLTSGLVVTIGFFWIALTGPRMRVQPHVLPYEQKMPPLPSGIVAVEQSPIWPDADTAGSQRPSAELLREGLVYYGYYCLFCHGETGKGDGPVGVSFIPMPRPFTASNVGTLSDSALIEAMMRGLGHDPLLTRVVPPGHRPALAAYVRFLTSGYSATRQTPPPDSSRR